MSKTAFLFPGQGSQVVGMGQDLVEAYPQARQLYDEADTILGFSLSTLCFEGPKEILDDTVNTQPAIFVTSLALLRVLEIEDKLPPPAMVAGHSLGELTALAAATGQREATVQAGLEWLAARGQVQIVQVNGDTVTLAPAKDDAPPKSSRQIPARLKALLEETRAYRSFFKRAAAEQLTDHQPSPPAVPGR